MTFQRLHIIRNFSIKNISQRTRIRRLESLHIYRIHLGCSLSAQDQSVHCNHHSFSFRFFGGSSNYRIIKVQRAIGTHCRRRTHRPDQYHRFITLHGEIQEKCRFFHRICPMSYHDTIYIITLEQFIDTFCQCQPNGIIHILRTNLYNLFTGHIGNLIHFGHCIQQCADSHLSGCIIRIGSRSTGSGNCSSCCQNMNIRLLGNCCKGAE